MMIMKTDHNHYNSPNNIPIPMNHQEIMSNQNKNYNSPQKYIEDSFIKDDEEINNLISTCYSNIQTIKEKVSELESNISTSSSTIFVQKSRAPSYYYRKNCMFSPNYQKFIPISNYSITKKNSQNNFNTLFDIKNSYFNRNLNNNNFPKNYDIKNKSPNYLSNYTNYINYINKHHNNCLSHKDFHKNLNTTRNKKNVNDLNNIKNINSIKKSSYIITDENILKHKNSQVAKLMQDNQKLKSQLNTVCYDEKDNNKVKGRNYFKQLQSSAKEIKKLKKSIFDYQKSNKSLRQQVLILNNKLVKFTKNSSEKLIKPKNSDFGRDNIDKIEKLVKMNDLYKKELQEKNLDVSNIKKRNNELITENDEYKNQIQNYKNRIDKLNDLINEKDKVINKNEENLKNGKLDNKREKSISLDKLLKENNKNKQEIEALKKEIKSLKDKKIKYKSLSQRNEKNSLNILNSLNDYTFENQQTENSNKINNKEIENNKNNYDYQDSENQLTTNTNKVDVTYSIKNNTIEKTINININSIDNSKKLSKNIINNKIPFKNKPIAYEKIKEISNEINKNVISVNENEDNYNYNYNSITLKTNEKNTKNLNQNKIIYFKNRIFEKCSVKISQNITIPLLDFTYEINPDIYKFRIKYKHTNSKILDDIFLYGIDEKNNFHKFDICNKLFTKQKISELKDLSNNFNKDFQYEGTIIYNTFYGVFLLTGTKTNILYFYNSYSESIIKICEFKYSHNNGTLLLDEEQKRIFALSGKYTNKCEYFSFIDMNIHEIANLNIDRANATFTLTDDNIFCFFGFCYSENIVLNDIEIIDNKNLNKWEIIPNLKLFRCNSNDLMIESLGGIYNQKFTRNKIILYNGIVGNNQEIMKDFYYEYDMNKNEIKKIKKGISNQYKYKNYYKSKIGWKKCEFNEEDLKEFIFVKCSNFLHIPKEYKIDGFSSDKISVLIDYNNNVHFIIHDPFQIDIYRSLK